MTKLKFRTKPYPHQKQATARAVAQGSHAFLFEPRCGKTKAMLDAIAVQHHRGEVDRVCVVAPLTVMSVWEDEIRAHLSVPANVKTIGSPAWNWYPTNARTALKKKIHERAILKIFLINYDRFSKRGEDEAYSNEWLKTIQSWHPDLLILDESHRVASAGAIRSQSLWRMVERLRKNSPQDKPWVYLATGTPGAYIKLFSQYRILDQTIFGTSKANFEDDYCVYGFGPLKHTVIRYRNKNRLLKKIKARATIVNAQEVGLSNKEFFNPIRVDLPPKAKELYNELVTSFIAELEDGTTISATNAGVLRLRLLQLTGGFTTDGKQIHSAKVEAAHDYLSDLCDQRENVVGYARFIPEVLALEGAAKRAGYDVHVIRGGVKRSDRAAYVDWFRISARRPKTLVFQVQSGALGLDLTAAAETLFFGIPDGWEAFFQGINRIKGPKQKRPVRHTFITAKGTLDLRVLDALRNKRDIHKEMMGNAHNFLLGL